MIALFLACCLAAPALANGGDDEPPKADPARPAIGEWIGTVSWNDPIVQYAWEIDPDGGFSSGRFGRGYGGGGAWSARGSRLTLKYDDGFRYEGELHDETYAGMAITAEGRPFGRFWMRHADGVAPAYEGDH